MIPADTPEELVSMLNKSSRSACPTDTQYMAEVAERMWTGHSILIRHDTAANFIADLMHHGFVHKHTPN
jgi:hypothetical protein